jgi:hypothetical protein
MMLAHQPIVEQQGHAAHDVMLPAQPIQNGLGFAISNDLP